MSLIIGLTGGIASGKSTVASMLKELSIPIVDADEEARLAVEPGERAYEKIIEYFGPEVLLKDGAIDRAKLGSIIFQNEEKRQVLNNIVHPVVRENMLKKREHYLELGHTYVVLDIPLLFESRLTEMVDKIILVYVDEEIQLERLMKRNGLTQVEAEARIASQMPLREKINLADAVINNNGSLEETKKQLRQILEKWGFTLNL